VTAPVQFEPIRHLGDAPSTIEEEQLLEQKEVAGLSQSQIVRRRFLRHKLAMTSLIVLAGIVVLSVTSIGAGPLPGWWKYSHTDVVPPNPDEGPTMSLRPGWLGGAGIRLGEHPFGLDNEIGRDMFAMTMKGVQTTLVVILVVGLMAVVIGVSIGASAGYFGGRLDGFMMRFTDAVIVIPLLVAVAMIAFVFEARGMWSVAIVLGALLWTTLARLVRAEFLSLRDREFVDAARVAGASTSRIIFKHILPNTVAVIVVAVTLLMGAAILIEAAVAFLGFGIQRPDVSLGNLVQAYDSAFSSRPWLFVWPGVFIVVIVLCLQFIGDGLRDAFDPRQKRVPKRRYVEAKAAEDAMVTATVNAAEARQSGLT
jgi:glutathione transport system permease protein